MTGRRFLATTTRVPGQDYALETQWLQQRHTTLKSILRDILRLLVEPVPCEVWFVDWLYLMERIIVRRETLEFRTSEVTPFTGGFVGVSQMGDSR